MMRLRLVAASLVLSSMLIYTALVVPSFVQYTFANYSILETEIVPEPTWEEIVAEKYFNEPGEGGILGHYDSRYYPGEPVSDEQRVLIQRHMVRAYLMALRDAGIETWLAHGTLLGWWWNKSVLPWDGDLDVQMTVDSLNKLVAEGYNSTIHSYSPASLCADEDIDDKEEDDVLMEYEYLMDINPYHQVRSGPASWANVIDARWIDITTGLFIDITAIAEVRRNMWKAKDEHRYRTKQLFPLKETTFEGTVALVPNNADQILREEYSRRSLISTHFEGYTWKPDLKKWIREPWEGDEGYEPPPPPPA